MYICTLLTSPQNPSLEPALVESLRNAWGGGDAIWLAPDEVAEFALAEIPVNLLGRLGGSAKNVCRSDRSCLLWGVARRCCWLIWTAQ